MQLFAALARKTMKTPSTKIWNEKNRVMAGVLNYLYPCLVCLQICSTVVVSQVAMPRLIMHTWLPARSCALARPELVGLCSARIRGPAVVYISIEYRRIET